jgi:outer membrane protein assembly factor BamE
MVGNGEAFFLGDGVLAFFNFCVEKFFDLAAIQTHQMVVVLAFVELVHRLATLEIAALENVGLFELGQHPVHRGQAHIRTLFQQHPKDIFCGHVALRCALENFQNFQSWDSGLEPGTFEFVDVGHGGRRGQRGNGRSKCDRTLQWDDHIVMPFPMLLFPVKAPRVLVLLSVVAALSACSTLRDAVPNKEAIATAVSPYKIDIIQGNVVTREQLEYLRPGMPRAQVRDVLGSALLASVFHADRWDYVFTLQRQGAQPQSRKVTVFFKNDLLDRVEADEVPSEKEFVSTLRSNAPKGPLPVLEMSADKRKATGASDGKPAAAAATAVPSAPIDPSAYPPLEPAQ